jgi:hypothetical protein
VAAPSPPPSIDPAKVEEVARQVLERAEFKDVAIPEPWTFRPPEVSSTVAWVLLIVACVLLGIAVFFLVRLVRRRLGRAGEVSAGAARKDSANEARTSAEAFSRAEANAARGDFREAMRLLHLAVLLRLAERQLLRFHESMTSGECARALKNDAARRHTYRRLAMRCDEVVFGDGPATRQAWEASLVDFAECAGD